MKRISYLIVAISASALAGGCSTGPLLTNAADVADTIGEITPSRNDTCETLRQVAVQTSKIRTIKEGREVVVKAPACKTG